MKILVIGAGGFIGRHLSASLEQAGADILAGYRERQPFSAGGTSRIRHLRMNLRDGEVIRGVLDGERPNAVIHLASNLVPGSSMAEYLSERQQLLDPTLRLLLDLAERGIRLVYFSSGGAIYGRSSVRALGETSACEPISFYGQSKLETESLIRFVARTSGLRYLIVRPSNPYGGGQSLHGRQGVVGAILGCLIEGRPLQVWGDGSAVRDFIHVDDLCEAVTHLVGVDLSADTVNVGSNVGHSLLDVVGTVEAVTGRRVMLDFHPPRAVDVPRVVLDTSRARALGVPPARSLSDGVRKTADGFGMLHA